MYNVAKVLIYVPYYGGGYKKNLFRLKSLNFYSYYFIELKIVISVCIQVFGIQELGSSNVAKVRIMKKLSWSWTLTKNGSALYPWVHK